MNDFTASRRGKAPIGGKGCNEKATARLRHGFTQIASKCACGIEIIKRSGDNQISVGIEIACKLLALIAQIRFDFKFDIECIPISLIRIAIAQKAAKALCHHIVGQVSDVANHARHLQSAPWHHRSVVKTPAVKLRIGDDRTPCDFIKRDVLRRQLRCGGNTNAMRQALGIEQAPCKRLHTAKTTPHHRSKTRYAKPVGKPCLGVYPILDREHRKVGAPCLGCGRIDRHWSGRTKTAPKVIDTHDEKSLCVDRLTWPNHVVPPARLAGFIKSCNMMRSV